MRALHSLAGLALLALAACASEEPTLPDLAALDEALGDYDALLDELAAEHGIDEAKRLTVEQMSLDPRVVYAESTSQGLSIEFVDSVRAFILLDPELDVGDLAAIEGLDPEASARWQAPESSPPSWSLRAGTWTSPIARRPVLLNPIEWQYSTSTFERSLDDWLSRASFGALEVHHDAEVDLERLASLDGYGLVHLQTHGIRHMSPLGSLVDVYALTGERVSLRDAPLPAKFHDDVLSGDLLFVRARHTQASERRVSFWGIGPGFVDRHNEWIEERPVVFLSVCSSFEGSWETVLTDRTHALAVVGYDGVVYVNADSLWRDDFYAKLSDPVRSPPLTVGAWFEERVRRHRHPKREGYTTLRIDGSPDAALPAPGKIVFVSDRTGSSEIHVMRDDGSEPRALTSSGDRAVANPVFSPDGAYVAFEGGASRSTEIFVMNADGSGLRQLTDDDYEDGNPSFSPDGARVVYSSYRPGTEQRTYGQLVVVPRAGGSETVVGGDMVGVPAYEPDWSRGGAIFFRGVHRDPESPATIDYAIFQVNEDGSFLMPVSPMNALSEEDPAVSPDGHRVLFRHDDQVWVMSSTGATPTALTSGGNYNRDAAWGPSGASIVFSSGRDGNAEIYVMAADGTGATNLTADAAHDYDPSWWGPSAGAP